jgi:hypothetical protein
VWKEKPRAEGDEAMASRVLSLVDDAHAPAADLAEDAVMGDRLTHGLGRRGHWVEMLGGRKGEVNRRRAVRWDFADESKMKTWVGCRAETNHPEGFSEC